MTRRSITKYLVLALSIVAAPLHAEFVKKDVFEARGLKDKVTVGSKDLPADTLISPEIRSSFKFGTTQEHSFLSLTRDRAVKSIPSSDAAGVTFSAGSESDIFKQVGDRLKWDVSYVSDPRGGLSGDFTETWTLDYPEGVNFYYQGELTPEDIAAGAYRPDDVVGSYAVYADKSGHYVDSRGNTLVNYGTGKLAHIYRPKILDVNSAEVWGVLSIVGKEMSVTIPGDFLDTAVFPVTLDPDLGYSSIGASASGVQDAATVLFVTSNFCGVGGRIKVRGNNGDANTNSFTTATIYGISDLMEITNGRTEGKNNWTTTPAWHVYFPGRVAPGQHRPGAWACGNRG